MNGCMQTSSVLLEGGLCRGRTALESRTLFSGFPRAIPVGARSKPSLRLLLAKLSSTDRGETLSALPTWRWGAYIFRLRGLLTDMSILADAHPRWPQGVTASSIMWKLPASLQLTSANVGRVLGPCLCLRHYATVGTW
jgi:hypothetical protein